MLSAEEQEILTLLQKKPGFTQKALSEVTEIPLRTVKRILLKLQEKGMLAREGSRRSGQWKVLRCNSSKGI